MANKLEGKPHEYDILYAPIQKGITRSLNNRASQIQAKEAEGWELCGFVMVPEGKLLGIAMRRRPED